MQSFPPSQRGPQNLPEQSYPGSHSLVCHEDAEMRPMCYPRAVLLVTDGRLLLCLCLQMEDLCEVSSGPLHLDYTR